MFVGCVRKAAGLSAAVLVIGAGLAGPAMADDTLTFEGGLTGIYQAASDDRVDSEASLSGDFFVRQTFGNWSINGHLEGSTTPRVNGVNALIPGANADSGSAVNSRDKGRVQLSELFLEYGAEGFTAAVGLIDATGFLDGSHVANDEAGQFINGSLVNNPSIEFPDYTLGGVMSFDGAGLRPSVTVLVGGSSGLADNPSRSYTELAQLGTSGKGVFAAAEFGWSVDELGEDGAIRLGVWTNTADHTRLDATSTDESNQGVYGIVDGTASGFAWNLRAGVADASVSPVAWFAGAAVEHELMTDLTGGLGVTHTAASDDLGVGFSDSTQGEVYLRYNVSENVHVTPSVQYVTNPGFDDTDTVVDDSVWVFGIRLGYDF